MTAPRNWLGLVFAALMVVNLISGRAEAGSSGFSGDDARDFARARVAASDRLEGVSIAAEEMRAGLVRNRVAYARQRAPMEMVALSGTFGGLNADSGYYLSWLFRSAIAVTSGEAREPVVTFYNPIVDVAVVSLWKRIDSTWRLSSMFVFDGATLRGGVPVAWTRAEGSYGEAMVAATRAVLGVASHISVGRILPPTITSAELQERMQAIRQRLQAVRADRPAAEAVERVRGALVSADPARLGLPTGSAPAALELATVDRAVRASLVPVAAFDRPDAGLSVLIGSPLRPGLLLLADFAAGTSTEPMRINVLNLGDTTPSAPAATVSLGAAQ